MDKEAENLTKKFGKTQISGTKSSGKDRTDSKEATPPPQLPSRKQGIRASPAPLKASKSSSPAQQGDRPKSSKPKGKATRSSKPSNARGKPHTKPNRTDRSSSSLPTKSSTSSSSLLPASNSTTSSQVQFATIQDVALGKVTLPPSQIESSPVPDNSSQHNDSDRGSHSSGRGNHSSGRGGHSSGRGSHSSGRGGHSSGRGGHSSSRGAHSSSRAGKSSGRGGKSSSKGGKQSTPKPSKDRVVPGARAPLPATSEAIEIDPVVNTRTKKIEELIKATTGSPMLSFNSLAEYFQHLTHCLYLEELFDNDFITNMTVEWSRSAPYKELSVIFNHREAMALLVNDKMKHLRKSPFTMNQAVMLVTKADTSFNTKPQIWSCIVQYSKVDKRHNRLEVVLSVNSWNETPLPAGSRGDAFALLPCSAVVTRVIEAMTNLEHPHFKELLLGNKPIKQIFFKNFVKFKNNLNDSQKVSVQSALNNSITILKGPPGSGKTSTIYEMILQLLENLNYSPILVVAASNIAVDNIAEKLMKDHKDDIIRILSLSKEAEYGNDHSLGDICLHNRVEKALPPHLHDIYTKIKSGNIDRVSQGEFSKFLDGSKEISQQLVAQAKVIFATTVAIGGPHLKRVDNLPVIIVDEATQTSEASSLIPLAAKGISKIIFVGDEAQLSSVTKVKALEMSLFERTLRNGTYQKPFMFDTQYRMHPDISEFPRIQFYDGKLKDGITAEDRQEPGIIYPLYFWDHQGKLGARKSRIFPQKRKGGNEEGGYTFINKKEVEYVERILENLMIDKQISPDRIGVITTYAGQRDLISSALEGNLLVNPNKKEVNLVIDKEDLEDDEKVVTHEVNGILIATVDAFQGREKDFIVMSCVRSNSSGSIGFMKDARRMNVALTRAKYSLIFTGDAKCLKRGDELWDKYISSLEQKNYVFTNELSY